MQLEIRGAHQLGALSKAMRSAGEGGKGLRRDLYRGIQRSTKGPKAAAKQTAATELPQRGGLAAEVARAKVTTRTRGGGRNVGVRIEAKGKYVRTTDRGVIRKTQRVPEGWFTETLQNAAPAVRRDILQAMESTADAIRRSV